MSTRLAKVERSLGLTKAQREVELEGMLRRALASVREAMSGIHKQSDGCEFQDVCVCLTDEQIVTAIGKPAIPKMQEALYQGDDRARGRAAWVLAWIGDKASGTIIKDAIAREKDPEVLKELKDALRELHSRWG